MDMDQDPPPCTENSEKRYVLYRPTMNTCNDAPLFVQQDEEDEKSDDDNNGRDCKRVKVERRSSASEHNDTANDFRAAVDPDKAAYQPIEAEDELDETADVFHDEANPAGRPKLAIYHPKYDAAVDLIKSISDAFLKTVQDLAEEGYHNPEIDNVCSNLRNVRNWTNNLPSIRPVALLGRCGVGKSSTLNCILDSTTLALETDCDARGTYVPHEYCPFRPDQDSEFFVAVPFMRPQQMQQAVKAHFKNIHVYLNLNTIQKEEYDEAELAEMSKKCRESIDFFCTLLREEVPELGDQSEARDWFETKKSETIEAGAKNLLKHVDKFMSTLDLIENEKTFAASDGQQMKDGVKKLARPGTDGSASAWALANCVRIHMDRDLLKKGVTLADLPGLDDSNEIVMDKTRSYLGRAGRVLVFANIGRVASDASLDRYIRECIEKGKASTTYLVVTNIDQKKKYQSDEKEGLPVNDRQLLEAAELHEQRLKDKESVLKAAKKSELSDGEYVRVDRELGKVRDGIIAADARMHQIAVQIRNRQVERQLKNKLRELMDSTSAPDLPVHFVSNSEYRKHLCPTDDLPRLDLEATGIPGLRRMLYHIPAEGRLAKLQNVCINRLPGVFNGILGILNFSKLERKHEVLEVIKHELSKLEDIPEEMISTLDKCFQSTVETVMTDDERKWQSQAEVLLRTWQGYNAQTFAAFCRREGRWRMRKGAPATMWNVQIQDLFARKVSKCFEEIEEKINGQSGMRIDFLGRVSQVFRTLKSQLEVHPGFQGVDMTHFFNQLLTIEKRATAAIARQLGATRVSMLRIRNKATVNELDSFVTEAMKSTFETCSGITAVNFRDYNTGVDLSQMSRKGPGAHSVRVAILHGKMRGDSADSFSVFADVLHLVRDEYDTLLHELSDHAEQIVSRAQSDVLADFDRRFAVEEVKYDEKQTAAMGKLKSAAAEAIRMVEGDLSNHVKACTVYEEKGKSADAP